MSASGPLVERPPPPPPPPPSTLILRRRGVINFIDKEEKILHYLHVSKMLALFH